MATPKKLNNGKYAIRPRFKDPITGEWTSRYATFNSPSEAKIWAARVITEASLGIENKDVTLGWYFKHWLHIYKEPVVDVKTIIRINDDFGYLFKFFSNKTKLKNITPGHYQMFLTDLGQTHAKSTCRHAHTAIRAMFRKAVMEGFLRVNPAEDAFVTGRKPVTKRPKKEVLEIDEFKKLLNHVMSCEDSVSRAALITHAYTGMRFGEVIGLTWDKIDFGHQTISVEQMYDHLGTHDLKGLKGDSKPRSIHVDQKFFNFMFQYRHWFRKSVSEGTIIPFRDFVFVTPNGTPLTDTGLNKYIADRCEEIGLTRITTHGFRRTMATLLNLKGANIKYISSLLGHTDIRTTQNYYIKKTDDLMKQGNQERDTLFSEIAQ